MRRNRSTTRFGAAAALLAMGLTACGASGPSGGEIKVKKVDVKVGGTLTYGADQEPTGFNSGTSKDNGTAVVNIAQNVLPSVFQVHPDFTVQLNKDLMVSVKQTSTKPQTLVYKISPKAVWSDGVPISAKDFLATWVATNGKNKGYDVASTTGTEDIASVTGSDSDKTVTVVFAKPFADWQSLFGGLLPSHLINAAPGGPVKGWNTGFDKGLPVSGGPFSFGTFKAGESLTLVRNDKYYGPKAKLDKLVFRFLSDSTTQPAALKNGEVQLIYPQPQLDLVSTVKALPGVKSLVSFGLAFEHLDFNTKTPGLDNVAVRKAIAMGLDRSSMLKRTVGQFSDKAQVLGNRIYLTGQPEYVDHSGGYGKGDTASATKLLTSAGYAKGSDGIYAKAGKKLSFRFSTTAGNKLRETQGELFKGQMKAIGIDIRIDNSPSKILFGERLPAANFDIADFAWVGTPFATGTKSIYTTGSASNYGKGSDPAVDALYAKVTAELDTAKRVALLNQVDEKLWASMVTIPLYQKPTFIAFTDTYGNIGDNASSEGPFWNSGTWGLL